MLGMRRGFLSSSPQPTPAPTSDSTRPSAFAAGAVATTTVKHVEETPMQLPTDLGVSRALLKVKQFSTISYAENPGAPVQEMAQEEFLSKHGCVYSETLHGTQNTATATEMVMNCVKTLGIELYRRLQSKVIERINNPLDAFVVTGMGTCGAGLFAKEDIKKGTVLFLYSGELIPKKDARSEYAMGMTDDTLIDAAKVGGLARFMQHLPSSSGQTPEREMIRHTLRRNQQALSSLATENVMFGQFMIRTEREDKTVENVLVNACFATSDINKGDLIGFDYSEDFIRSRRDTDKPIAYFSKKGEKIGEVTLK